MEDVTWHASSIVERWDGPTAKTREGTGESRRAMRDKFWAAVLITTASLARAPTASGIAMIQEVPGCSKSLDSESTPQLVERIKKSNDQFGLQVEGFNDAPCVIDALERRGDGVLPSLISLMKTRDPTIESLVLTALCRQDNKGAAALPYIEKRLRGKDSLFDKLAYPALTCMGDKAKSAIPTVIRKSVSCSTSVPSDCDAAIDALGDLAQYDREHVVPHLMSLLDQPAHFEAAAKALEAAGDSARAAQEPLIQKLAAATAAHQGDRAAILISALKGVGDPVRTAEVLTVLLEHPDQTDPHSRAAAVSALVRVAPGSRVTLQAVLDEGVRERQFGHFYILASTNPFPSELAPAVVTAIHDLQGEPSLVSVLRKTLVHTHSDLQCCQPVPEPTRDVSEKLALGLISLTRQSRPIVVKDLLQQLHLDPNNYDDQGDAIFRRLSHKPANNPGSPQPDLIDSMNLSEVRQELDIVLRLGYCVSATAVRSRVPALPEPKSALPTITVTAVDRYLDPGVIRFQPPGEKDRCGLMDLEDRCPGYVRIVKTFKDDQRCALIPRHQDSYRMD